MEDVSGIADTRHVIGRGQESVVFLSRGGASVIKLNRFTLVDSEYTPFHFFEGIKAYNELRPDTRLDIIGFPENEAGDVCAVMRQPYVRARRNATQKEIDAFLETNGDFATGRDGMGGRIVHKSPKYTIHDAEPRNVLVGIDGGLFFIDLIVQKNHGEPQFAGAGE